MKGGVKRCTLWGRAIRSDLESGWNRYYRSFCKGKDEGRGSQPTDLK